MEKTTLYLPTEMLQALRALARRKGCPQAEVIRAALRNYLDQQERPLPRSVGMGDDPDLHGADTEDWLAANWHPE